MKRRTNGRIEIKKREFLLQTHLDAKNANFDDVAECDDRFSVLRRAGRSRIAKQ